MTAEMEELIFTIILHAGNARSYALEAISLAREGQLDLAHEKINLIKPELNAAHKLHANFLTTEARDGAQAVSIMFVHAEDHLMNALTVKDLATEFIHIYSRLSKLGV